jgi:hypothetical protein
VFKIVPLTRFFAEILLLGTGDHAMLPPAHLKKYLNGLGIQLDVMNSVCLSSGLETMLFTALHTIVECVLDLQYAGGRRQKSGMCNNTP